jgi:methylated-DNA-[protein]-cysteine S-methyltransferase
MHQKNMKPSVVYSESDQDPFVYTQSIETPVGHIVVGATDAGLRYVKINPNDQLVNERPNVHTEQAIDELLAYFEGRLSVFTVGVDISGYTDFSQRVWRALVDIPYGKTISYLELSEVLGDVKAIRAVGTANGRNPLPIIIPCHRVIGSDGSLTGYALGLEMKRKLLAIENPAKYAVTQTSLF